MFLHLKLVILLEYQDIKIFLLKVTLQIGRKKFLWLKNQKYCATDVNEEVIAGTFSKKNCKKQVKKNLDLKK